MVASVFQKIRSAENKSLVNRPQDLLPLKLPFYLELCKVVRSDSQQVPGSLKLVFSGTECWSDSPTVYSVWQDPPAKRVYSFWHGLKQNTGILDQKQMDKISCSIGVHHHLTRKTSPGPHQEATRMPHKLKTSLVCGKQRNRTKSGIGSTCPKFSVGLTLVGEVYPHLQNRQESNLPGGGYLVTQIEWPISLPPKKKGRILEINQLIAWQWTVLDGDQE